MKPRGALAIALLCGACSAQISDGRGASAAGPDASPGSGPGVDAAPGVDASPGPDAMVGCTRRSVYLNFEGQTLVRGRSDATLNQAEWMTIDQGTAPPYLAGSANRAAIIQTIVDGVRRQLAQFPITVVTSRPAAGSYVMIVYGGRAGAVGSRYSGAVTRLDCDDSRPNDVAWVSDIISPTQRVINASIGAIGFGLGLTATLAPTDCLCGWDNDCDDDETQACTLGSPIDRDPFARQLCLDATRTQDEVATFRAAFCQ